MGNWVAVCGRCNWSSGPVGHEGAAIGARQRHWRQTDGDAFHPISVVEV